MEKSFVTDIYPQGCYFCAVLRSPVACGTLKEIIPPEMPGTYTLITAEHIPGANRLDGIPTRILAKDKVSYIGEPVGLLTGPDEARLLEYVSLCQIRCDESPPVFFDSFKQSFLDHIAGRASDHPDDVLEERSPQDAYIKLTIGEKAMVPAREESPEATSVAAPLTVKEAAEIVEGVYSTGVQEHWYAEPHAAVAAFDADGGLSVYTATQWQTHAERSVRKALKLPKGTVTVFPQNIGVHLDSKLWYPSLACCHAALAAFVTGKPARLCLTRDEDFRYSPKRNAAEIAIRSELDENSVIISDTISILTDAGASGVLAGEILDNTCLGAMGFYQTPQNATIEARSVRTNIPEQGPFSGYGLAQGFFAAERHASLIADALHIDPAEWRKRRLIGSAPGGASLAIGAQLSDAAAMLAVMETAEKMSDYKRKWVSYELLRQKGRDDEELPARGIGIAIGYQGNGFLHPLTDKGIYGVEITLKEDENLEICTSAVPTSELWERVLRQNAARILSMDENRVSVRFSNTPDSGPSTASRNIAVILPLVEKCCYALKKQRFRAELPLTVRHFVRPSKAASWSSFQHESFRISKTFDTNALSAPGYGAAVVEIEIEKNSYTPKIRGVWFCADGGRICSPQRARNSLAMSIIHALGWASREEVFYENGAIPDGGVYGYSIPEAAEFPPIDIQFLEREKGGAASYEAVPKGVSDLPFNTLPAAYAQAVSQALNHPFKKIPLCAQDLWDAVHNSKESA